MRPIAQAIILSLLLFTAAASHAASSPAPAREMPDAFLLRMKPILEDDATTSKIDEELEKIGVPNFHPHDATLPEVLEQVNAVIIIHNSNPSAIQIPPLRIYPDHPQPTPVTHENPPDKKPGAPENTRITLNYPAPKRQPDRFGWPMKWVIKDISHISYTVIDIEPDAIWLKSLATPENLTKRVYFIPYSICYTKVDVEYMLRTHFWSFDLQKRINPDVSWDFDNKSHLLTLQYGDLPIMEFEKWFARELLKRGFKNPVR